jgi:hypothetical protein
MKCPAIRKSSGCLPANTLDFPLFTRLIQCIETRSNGPTLELFSHETPRADVSNCYVPGNEPEVCSEFKEDGKLVYGNPITTHVGAPHDIRQMLKDDNLLHFSSVWIDPPFTEKEQAKLYSDPKTSKNDHNQDICTDITSLYQQSIDYATTVATHSIIVWGYRAVPELTNGWSLSLLVIAGGGSGHPDIIAAVYTPNRASEAQVIAEYLLSKVPGCTFLPSVEITTTIPFRTHGLSLDEHEVASKTCIELIQRQDTLAQRRQKHPSIDCPALHPQYLSFMWFKINEFVWRTKKRVNVLTSQAQPFASAKVAKKKHSLKLSVSKLQMIASQTWADEIKFHLQIEQKKRKSPKQHPTPPRSVRFLTCFSKLPTILRRDSGANGSLAWKRPKSNQGGCPAFAGSNARSKRLN